VLLKINDAVANGADVYSGIPTVVTQFLSHSEATQATAAATPKIAVQASETSALQA
jgi:hypothetical protein